MRSGDVLSGGDKPLRVPTALVSANLFRLLGVEPIRGRSFDSEEDQPGNDVVIIVSHGLWQRHFGANPEVIGQQIVLSDRSYEVIGVMPPDFELPGLTGVDAWRPWALSARELQHGRVGHVIPYLTGRLKSDATLEQARQELGAIADGLAREYPESHNGLGVGVEPMVADTVRDVRTALLMLFGAVGLVLLLATTNVAAMLVSRAIERQPEMALRRALGGRTWRLVRQLLTEGLILGLVGAAMGVFFAYWWVRSLLAIAPQRLPRTLEVAIDGDALGFTVSVALLSTVLCSLVPAWQISRFRSVDALRTIAGSRIAHQRTVEVFGRRTGSHSLLVVAQMALALLLLVGSGLFIRSFVLLQQVDPGIETENVLMAHIILPDSRYTRQQTAEFSHQLVERTSALSQVNSAGLTMFRPVDDGFVQGPWDIPRAEPGQPSVIDSLRAHYVTPDYFRTVGIPLLQGRVFSASEQRREWVGEWWKDGSSVAVVNETLATRYFSEGGAIGKHIASYEIVGVVGDVRQNGRHGPAPAQAYFSLLQEPVGAMWLAIRTEDNPLSLVAAIRAQVLSIDPEQPVARFATMEELLADSLAEQRFSMVLMSVFGALALVLVAVGIYGVASYSAARRTREFGIRRALGAQTSTVFWLVLREGSVSSLAGLGIGVVAALWLTRLIASQIYVVTVTDSLTFVSVSVGLVAVALIASSVPALRATRADPIESLRAE